MQVKIFSHKSDPDGLGSVVLASFAYGGGVSITLCKGIEELDEQLSRFIEEKEYAPFEQIFVTDLCPSNFILDSIDSNEALKNKVFIFDHHKSSMDRITKEYSFLTETEMKEEQKCCGTSLFYEYLVKQSKLLDKEATKTFVELTRLHDTYEWKNENNADAYYLQILFQFFGPWGYFYHFSKKLENENSFVYTLEEQIWIKEQIRINQQKIEEIAHNIVVIEKEKTRYGVSIADYEYRNLLADYFKSNEKNIDVLLLIAGDENRFSFRSIKSEIDVNKIAELCGGGGHPQAAGGELNQETLRQILKFLN